jgi:hypothetical protein
MLSRMVDDEEMTAGGVDTGWLERGLGRWLEPALVRVRPVAEGRCAGG